MLLKNINIKVGEMLLKRQLEWMSWGEEYILLLSFQYRTVSTGGSLCLCVYKHATETTTYCLTNI